MWDRFERISSIFEGEEKLTSWVATPAEFYTFISIVVLHLRQFPASTKRTKSKSIKLSFYWVRKIFNRATALGDIPQKIKFRLDDGNEQGARSKGNCQKECWNTNKIGTTIWQWMVIITHAGGLMQAASKDMKEKRTCSHFPKKKTI